MASTPGSTLTYAEKVEADKRSILSKALKADLLKVSRLITQFEPMTNKNNSKGSASDDEYASVFGDDDEDDSDEVFNKALAEARAQFLREQELKRKNPFHVKPNELFKAPPKRREWKRKSKAIQDTIKVMNDFKKNLLLAEKPKPAVPTVSTVSTKKTRLSSENSVPVKSTQAKPPMKIYPSWKTTATYTPIFSMPSNPRWTNMKSVLDSRKMQTPMQSQRQTLTLNITSKNNHSMVQTPYRSIRSDATTCHTEVGNKSPSVSPQSPVHLSTPAQKGTIVRFKPSPHEQIPCSSDEWSNSSSDSQSYESLQQNQNCIKIDEVYQNYENCDGSYQSHVISPLSFNDSFELENKHVFNQRNHMNHYQEDFVNDHDDKDPYDYISISNETNDDRSNIPGDLSIFMKDFTSGLRDNLDRNRKMKIEYSMKVKYLN